MRKINHLHVRINPADHAFHAGHPLDQAGLVERTHAHQHAETKGSEAQITVRIISQLISATYDKADVLIEGDAENVAEVNDLWTFARDTRSRDPNWKLVATESEHE